MMSRRRFLLVLGVGLSLSGLSCSRQGDAITLQGCGGTFPAPLYKRWFLEYYKRHPEVRTNYQAIGSGAGIRQFSSGLVTFGASVEALDRKKLEAAARDLNLPVSGKELPVLQIPMTAGSVALCYNLPGVSELRLTRKAYVGIILGDIGRAGDRSSCHGHPPPHPRQ
jgi:phosphate transport system substrate-binding protein